MPNKKKQSKKMQPASPVAPTNLLTTREKEIVRLHMQGKNRKDIARILKVEVSTIDAHTNIIHIKTGTHDVSGVIKYGHDFHVDKK